EHYDVVFRLEHCDDMFQLEHCDVVFQPEHSLRKPLRPSGVPSRKSLECSDWNIGHVLHTKSTAHGNSTLHSKCKPLYSANSSGSSTIYGTRHCCCQSEGRRG